MFLLINLYIYKFGATEYIRNSFTHIKIKNLSAPWSYSEIFSKDNTWISIDLILKNLSTSMNLSFFLDLCFYNHIELFKMHMEDFIRNCEIWN